MRVYGQPAYLLYSRPWSESSLFVGVFSRTHGRVGLLAKGARRLKSRMRGVLRPFQPLVMNWSGRGELASLYNVEVTAVQPELRREALLCAFYMNELLLKLLHKHDPHEKLYDRYADILLLLADDHTREPALRCFEKYLLEEIGYGLILHHEADSRTPIEPDRCYHYHPERGALLADENTNTPCIHGQTLLALHQEQLTTPRELEESKRLLRMVLHHYLGGRELNSRKFAVGMREMGGGGL